MRRARALGMRGHARSDQLITLTEGVIPHEERGDRERIDIAGAAVSAPRARPRPDRGRPAAVDPSGAPCADRGPLAAARGRAADRARRPARPRLRPARPLRPARRRPPLHRARLPAGVPRGRRHPPGRLRAGPLAALLGRLGGVARDLGTRRRVRPRRRRRSRSRSAPPPGPFRLHLFLHPTPAARLRALLARDRDARPDARVGLRPLEEPRRLRAPGRRRGRLARLPRERAAARRDRDRLALGDAVQHLALQPAPVPGRAGHGRARCARTGSAPSSG